MDKKKLEVKLRQLIGAIDTNGKLEEIADYIIDNFVSKEEVQNREADLQDLLNDYWEKKLQDSKPRECSNCGWRIGKNCGNGANACLNHNQWTPIDKPRECEHEWVTYGVGENQYCKKCPQWRPKPTPKLPSKLDEKPGLYDIYMTINDLIDYLAERG